MIDLRRRSIDVILENQAKSGGYIACPNMADYAYCWFRDSTFIAYAMDVVGEHESARRFYQWGVNIITSRAGAVERAVHKAAQNAPLDPQDSLHTRYTLQGEEGSDESWPNFQLDGIGTWLWGLHEHMKATGQRELRGSWAQASQLAARYLDALWCHPNYDLWEEFGEHIHPYTLGTIYAGLRAYTALADDETFSERADDVRNFILQEGVQAGHFVKYVGSDAVDASLLGLSVPYGVVVPDDPHMQKTVARIESELRHEGGGVQRYAWDSYYGGGQWLLLAAWLGWYYVTRGNVARARSLHSWVAAQQDEQGHLPEQIPQHLIAPDYYEKWIEIRGPIANPLLWSHAMYLILDEALLQQTDNR